MITNHIFFKEILKAVCLSVDLVQKLIQNFFPKIEQKLIQRCETAIVANACNASYSFDIIVTLRFSTLIPLSPIFVFRKLFTADFISKIFECGLKHLGYFTHIKISCMFTSYAVFIRYMMITRGEDIRMAGEYLRPNQASLKNIILIAVFGVIIGCVCGFGMMSVHTFFPNLFLYQMICQDAFIQNNGDAIKISQKNMLINLANLFVNNLLCFYNQLRVNRYLRGHGKCYFSHTRQNIITFRQVVNANYILNTIHMFDMVFLNSIRHPFNPFKSQQDYKHFMEIYYCIVSAALTFILSQT